MQFQVPQFIEVEDKIFGPLTLKQFIYVAGGGGIVVSAFALLPWFVAIFIALPVGFLAAALAFWKINNKPFIEMLEAMVKFYSGDRLYIWKKLDKPIVKKDTNTTAQQRMGQIPIPKLSESRLKKLTWSLDIHENENPATPSEEE